MPSPRETHVAALVKPGDLILSDHGPALVTRVTLDTEQGLAVIDATCQGCLVGGEFSIAASSPVIVIRNG